MRLLLQLVSVTALVAHAAACSSSGTGSGPGAVSSVDATKTVGSLTDTEAKQLCEDTQRFSDAQVSAADRKQVACGLGAQLVASSAKTDAEAKANCTAQYDACLVRPLPTQGDAGATTNACDKAKDDLKDCAATVNELNTCTATTPHRSSRSSGKTSAPT